MLRSKIQGACFLHRRGVCLDLGPFGLDAAVARWIQAAFGVMRGLWCHSRPLVSFEAFVVIRGLWCHAKPPLVRGELDPDEESETKIQDPRGLFSAQARCFAGSSPFGWIQLYSGF